MTSVPATPPVGTKVIRALTVALPLRLRARRIFRALFPFLAGATFSRTGPAAATWRLAPARDSGTLARPSPESTWTGPSASSAVWLRTTSLPLAVSMQTIDFW